MFTPRARARVERGRRRNNRARVKNSPHARYPAGDADATPRARPRPRAPRAPRAQKKDTDAYVCTVYFSFAFAQAAVVAATTLALSSPAFAATIKLGGDNGELGFFVRLAR